MAEHMHIKVFSLLGLPKTEWKELANRFLRNISARSGLQELDAENERVSRSVDSYVPTGRSVVLQGGGAPGPRAWHCHIENPKAQPTIS